MRIDGDGEKYGSEPIARNAASDSGVLSTHRAHPRSSWKYATPTMSGHSFSCVAARSIHVAFRVGSAGSSLEPHSAMINGLSRAALHACQAEKTSVNERHGPVGFGQPYQL